MPYDLIFPDVFFPTGVIHAREHYGFHVVLGNPPWDAIQFKTKEFLAAYDFDIMNAPTKREREAIENKILSNCDVAHLFEYYIEDFEQQKRINDRMFNYQKVSVGGDLCGRQLDAFRIFMERNTQLLSSGGFTGVVVPSAFHANEGATGVRQLYLQKMALKYCYSFENRRKLFEIDSRFKFACVVAEKTTHGTDEFNCAFYLHNDEWLFSPDKSLKFLIFQKRFIEKTGNEYLSFLELRDKKSHSLIEQFFKSSYVFSDLFNSGLKFRMTELHMSHDTTRFIEIRDANKNDVRLPDQHKAILSKSCLILHEGKTYHQYTDLWVNKPRYLIPISNLTDKKYLLQISRFFRIAFRAIASSTNERTMISAMLPPGILCGHTSPIEEQPEKRSYSFALFYLSLFNSFSFDFLVRQKVQASIGLYILESIPIIHYSKKLKLLVHSALRLSANHCGYLVIWQEYLDNKWREPNKPPFTWPVLETEEERWEVRSAIDAVVADAYGLNREQYEHVLGSFDMPSRGPNPHTGICLEKFDELKKIGLDAFTKKYDPYWDIPLNEELPKPVIDIPGLDDLTSSGDDKKGQTALGFE